MNIETIEQRIQQQIPHCITTTKHQGKKYVGKVRDTYDLGKQLAIMTTDRLSAFDRQLTAIPFKGEVLNRLSAWWFQQTQHIIANHVIDLPKSNTMNVKKCHVFPVEFVVRNYITGTTNTALWTLYKEGLREVNGYTLPEGLQKNQILPQIMITPTTKDKDHDRPITATEIIAEGRMTAAEWQQTSQAALALFAFGQQQADKNGVILVDTKYEFGKDANDNIILVDEIHTPDSSRYWLKASYHQRLVQQQEPENFDKEIIRLWYRQHCDPYNDKTLPAAPEELIIKVAKSYIQIFEILTQTDFFKET